MKEALIPNSHIGAHRGVTSEIPDGAERVGNSIPLLFTIAIFKPVRLTIEDECVVFIGDSR